MQYVEKRNQFYTGLGAIGYPLDLIKKDNWICHKAQKVQKSNQFLMHLRFLMRIRMVMLTIENSFEQ